MLCPFSVLLTFNTSLHPFLPFFSSSYNCCSHHCSALLPFSPWHVSLDHLFAAQKATCCSEHARTASRPSLALNTEHMLSQLSRAQQSHPKERCPLPRAHCLSAGFSACAMARPAAAVGENSRLWEEAPCFTYSSMFTGKKLNHFWGGGSLVFLFVYTSHPFS